MLISADTSVAARVVRAVRPRVAVPLERALYGGMISAAEATALLQADADQTAALLVVAGRIRDTQKGRTITYAPKVFLPITNLCRNYCAYCTFRKGPEDPAAWTMLPEDVRLWSRRGAAAGCVEALMCLGDKPEIACREYRDQLYRLGHASTVEYVARSCRIALEEELLPHTNAGLMSREQMAFLKPLNASLGLMLESVSPRLCQRGGPHYNAPDKDPGRRLKMIAEAGELQIPFTTGILVGIGETLPERAASLAAIRAAHARHGHIQEVIIQNFRAKVGSRMAGHPEAEALDLARTVAVARLMMPQMNIQAPPNLNPYDHRLLLGAGINDWGGISPLTSDYVNPEARWPLLAVLAETCASAGFVLEPRLPIYSEYVRRPGFLAAPLRPVVETLAARRNVRL